MWEDIMLSIVSAVGEAVCTNRIDKRKREKFNAKISSMVSEDMSKFADTSLDCDEFYALVQSKNFVEIIKNYFCSTKDGLDYSKYMESFEEYIYKECPSVERREVREFIRRIWELYEVYLHKMIMEAPELNAAFQLLTISQREIMSKILNSEENRKRYFSALEKASVKIENSEIKAYHDICQKEYGNIRFTGIAGAENKKAQDINDFYVENTFSYYVTKEYRDIYREGIEQINP